MPPAPWMNISSKPRLSGQLIGFVAQVPFAEYARRITGRLQQLGQRRGAERQSLALVDRVRDAILEFVPAGQQRGPRRRTRRAYVKVREAARFRFQNASMAGVWMIGFPRQAKSP